MQEVLGEGPQLLRRFNQPLQHRIRIDLEHPRRAPDAQALSQARDDTHDEVDGGTLPMKDRPEALQEVAATGDAADIPHREPDLDAFLSIKPGIPLAQELEQVLV